MEQHIKCPRCDSLDTKFCYYNNYSELQPRYKCKACKRYWTQGGALRDVPVGGGSRPRKTRPTESSSSSSTSAVSPPLPPQSLPQEVVQNQMVSPSLPIIYHQGSDGVRDGDYYVLGSKNATNSRTSFTSAPPQPLLQQVVQNQLVSSPVMNPISQPFNSLPITRNYHEPFNQPLNPISQPFNQSPDGDVLVLDHSDLALLSGFKAAESLALEHRVRNRIRPGWGYYQMDENDGIESLYPTGQGLVQPSVADNNADVAASHYTDDQYPQSIINNDNNLASDDQYPQPLPQKRVHNQLVSPSVLNPKSQPFNQLESPSLPITSNNHEPFNQPLNPISQPFNQPLDGDALVLDSSDLALLSGFEAAESLSSEHRVHSRIRPGWGYYQMDDNDGIESMYPVGQGLIQPSVADNSSNAVVSHNPDDQYSQSFNNSDNNLASDEILWSNMFKTTSSISGDDSDMKFSMPNHLPGFPGYGPPQQ